MSKGMIEVDHRISVKSKERTRRNRDSIMVIGSMDCRSRRNPRLLQF